MMVGGCVLGEWRDGGGGSAACLHVLGYVVCYFTCKLDLCILH